MDRQTSQRAAHLVPGELCSIIRRIDNILDTLVERAVRRIIKALHVAPALHESALREASPVNR